MGSCSSRTAVAADKEATLLMLGLDHSGKTTVIANLSGEPTAGATPSMGFSSTKLDLDGFQATFYDVGGATRLQNIWKNYYSETSGSIFVVDASAHSRLEEAKEVLAGIAEHEKMRGKPLLILANKQDSEEALSEDQVGHRLDLDQLLGGHRNLSLVVKCAALRHAGGDRADPAIRRGVKWLLKQIGQDYGRIRERVNADVAVQRAMEAQKRKERSERVRKIKEERERQQTLAGVVTDDEEELDGEQCHDNPFKPIKQAAVETEAREKASKARSKEIQERLSSIQDASCRESTGETTCAMPIETSDSRLVGEGVTSVDGREEGGDGESVLTSGLSTSTNSLTDVTAESQSSTESLHSVVQPSLTPHAIQDVHVHAPLTTSASQTQVGKRKRRSMLLARLKARSKTAPLLMLGDQTAHPSQDTPKAFTTTTTTTSPTTSTSTWTAAPLEAPADQPPPTISRGDHLVACPTSQSSPLLFSKDSNMLLSKDSNMLLSKDSNMQGLPEVPRTRVILPPLRMIKEPVGMVDKVLHTGEDIDVIPDESFLKLVNPPNLAMAVEPLSS